MKKIKFGWTIPRSPTDNSEPSRFVKQISQNLSQLQDTFDSAWITDHFVAPPALRSPDITSLESWTSICYLASAFPHLHFGSLVLSQSFRNPALLAKMTATLQLWTGGRFILGIGAGWLEAEYVAYGYEYRKTAVRVRQLEEAVQIIRKMWTETPATFKGKHYKIDSALCEPRPNPVPPIMIGGAGETFTLRAVAKYADWWNLMASDAETYAHKLEVLRSHCDKVGRDYSEIFKTWAGMVAIAETEAQAWRLAKASPYYRDGHGFIKLVGSPDQVTEQIHDFKRLGVGYFILGFPDFPDPSGAALFAKEVIPKFR